MAPKNMIDKPMNIGIVLSSLPIYSETFFISKINGLIKSGFNVTIFVQNNDLDFNLCSVVKAPSVNKGSFFLQFIKACYVIFKFFAKFPKRFVNFVRLELRAKRSIIQILKNIYNNYHILSSEMDWLHFGFATMAIQSEHVAKTIDAKMGVSLRGYDVNVFPRQNPKCYNLLWQNVDKVHSISNYLLNEAYRLGLSKQKPFKIITPAVDLSVFKSDNQYLKEKNKIITVSRLHKIKDIDLIVEAMVVLKHKALDFEYLIVGEGSERHNLSDQIKSLNLERNVRLIGKKDQKSIVELLKQSDIYIQYSETEGFCNAVLEAQAIGLLCIVSNGGALPENVIHEKTGWVIPKKDPKLLAQTIYNVIHLPNEIKQQISVSAKKRVISEFNLEKQQQLFKAFYENE